MSEKVASLPMYDSFVSYESSDAIWNAIKEGSADEAALPSKLDKFSSCYTMWTAGTKLTLTQACGYPLVREYSQFLKVVGTPLYAAPGCKGTTYSSAVVVRSTVSDVSLSAYLEKRGGLTLAVNSFGSFSGWLMLLSSLADSLGDSTALAARKFERVVLTGSHIGSMKAVQDGTADLACIDCVSLALARNHCPLLVEGLRVIGWSLPAPALPYATHKNATDEEVASLRQGLDSLVRSTAPQVVEARQHHLLAGIDTTGAVSLETYERAVQHHIAVANSHAEVAALFEALPPGRPPRLAFAVPVPAYSSVPEGKVKVDLTAKLGDATWPVADTTLLHGLKRFLARYLWDTVHHACCEAIGGETYITTSAKRSPIETALTEDLLLKAVAPIVGKQLWPTLPDGGKPKVIFCSVRGVLLLLRNMHKARSTDDAATGRDSALVYNASYDSICAHSSWEAISRVARALLKRLTETTAGQQRPVAEAAGAVEEPVDESDFYWAGFMGAGAASLHQYFPEEYLTAPAEARTPESLQSDPATQVIAKLWDADIQLSTHLVNVSRSGTNGMICYISAPRHNDRGDWGNLVITEDEAAIERWRDSRGHTAVRTHVAPHSYDHIRLHRGVLAGGLQGPKIVLKRTVFLGPVESGATAPVATATSEPPSPQEKILLGLRIAEPSPPSTPNGREGQSSGCPHSQRGLQRHVVYWADVPPHGPNGVVTEADDAYLDANKTVPGGVHVTLSQFKQQLLDEKQCPFVVVDETMTSPSNA